MYGDGNGLLSNMIGFDRYYKSGLEDWLTLSQVECFLNKIGVEQWDVDLMTLRSIIQGVYATIPFQNFTMLCRPKTPPTQEQIIADMLSGLGGLCTTSNPFLCALLQAMGFKAGLHLVSMDKPDCHIGVLVSLKKRCYFVDVGNGFPYLEPLELSVGEKYKVMSFEYELVKVKQGFGLQQTIFGTRKKCIDQTFSAEVCHYSDFDTMRKNHYEDSVYGPFLTSLRINRWTNESGFMLRDKLILNFPGKRYKADLNQVVLWLHNNFNEASRLEVMLLSSWERLFEK